MKSLYYLSILVLTFSVTHSQWVQMSNGIAGTPNVSTIIEFSGYQFAATDSGIYRSSDSGNNWSRSGLPGTRVIPLAANSTTIFAGTYNAPFTNGAGVFRSIDNGATWSPTSVIDLNVFSLAANGNTIFAGTNGGVLRSTDNGQTWVSVSFSQLANSLFIADNTVFAGTYTALYVSRDNGNAWSQTTLTSSVNSMVAAGGKLFAGTYAYGIYSSSDAGVTWQHNQFNSGSISQLAFVGSTLLAATNGYSCYGIYVSNNLGATWQMKNEGLSDNTGMLSLCANSNHVFAGMINNTSVWRRNLNELTGNSTPGLVAYYPFNGNANDMSGNNYHGVVHGATLTSNRGGYPNSAYHFNGSSDYIEIPGSNQLHCTSGHTLAAWVRFTVSSGLRVVVGKHISGYGNGYYLMLRPAPTVEYYINSEPGLQSSGNYNDGNWHFLTGVFDGTEMKLYIDGQLKTSQARTYSTTNDSTLLIGKHHSGVANDFFDGDIDDIRLYSIPLSATEILQLYNEPTGLNGEDPDLPSEIFVSQNFPNPFNPSTSIRYSLPENSRITVTLNDLRGAEVKQILRSTVDAGDYELHLDASDLSSGVYFCNLKVFPLSGGKPAQKTVKMVLIK